MIRLLAKGLGSKMSTIVAITLWGLSMFFIYEKNYAVQKASDLTLSGSYKTMSGEIQNWMNVTLNKAKIGYTMQSFSNTPLGYLLKDYSLIRMPIGGTVKEIYLDSYAVLNQDYSLKTFTFGLVSGEYTTDIYGEIKDDKLRLKIKSQNSETETSVDAPKGIYLPGVVPILLSARDFPLGEFSLPTFDPLSLAASDMQIAIGQVENVKTDLGELSGHRVSLTMSGVETKMWIDKKGHVLLEEETGGMKMTAADKENALNIPLIQPDGGDILADLAVKCNGAIKDPWTCRYLKVRIDGIGPSAFDLNDDFQTVISTDPLILEIHTDKINSSPLNDPQKFLRSEPLIQTDDPAIKEAALEIAPPDISPDSGADNIYRWVYKNIKKDYTVSLPSAVDVLKVRKGDCNEHSALFTALGRAAGIPTKICIGLVYKDGSFYYHAWPAVHVNGWRPLDPTFGQQIADATHIKLLEGGLERQADLMKVVGRISVTIMDTSEQ